MTDSVLITIRVHPSSSKNEITAFREGAWYVRVAAPPVRGKANAELLDYLSRLLGIRKSNLSVVRGTTAHVKVIAVEGLSQEEITAKLSSAIAGK